MFPFRFSQPRITYRKYPWRKVSKMDQDQQVIQTLIVLTEESKKGKGRFAARLEALKKNNSDTKDVEDTSVNFPALSPAMLQVINNALDVKSQEEIVSFLFDTSVTRRDLETIKGSNWLNDTIIDFYFKLLMKRSKSDNYRKVYAFSCYFWTTLSTGAYTEVKSWTKNDDIFSHDLILVPVNTGMHWCLAVIDFQRKTIHYYDSTGGTNNECAQKLCNYLGEELMDKKKETFDASGWVQESVKMQ